MGPDLIEFDSYTLVDAFATYKFNDNATLFLNVENLANTAYKPAHYLDKRLVGRGRTVMGGLTVKF
ncbi:TonB-dependent receptor [Ensifer adhaerens]|nr:TonB-dependent receptor [Ensifer adhaerens]